MRGDDGILEVLNEVLTAELTAINQYFLHAKIMDDWGYERLASHTRSESIDDLFEIQPGNPGQVIRVGFLKYG